MELGSCHLGRAASCKTPGWLQSRVQDPCLGKRIVTCPKQAGPSASSQPKETAKSIPSHGIPYSPSSET